MSDLPPPAKPIDVRRSLFSGFGVLGLFTALRIAQQILLVPILIGAWGTELYQDWIVLSSTAGLFAMLDLGFQIYFGNSLMIAWSQQDLAEFRRHFGVAASLYLVVLCLGAVLLAVLACCIPLTSLLGVNILRGSSLLWTFLPLAASTLCLIPLGLLTAVYRVHGNYVSNALFATVAESSRGFGVCAVALLGGGPVIGGWGYLVIALLLWGGTLIHIRKRYGPLPSGLTFPTIREVLGVLSKSSLYLMPTAVAPLILNVPIILLGRFGAVTGEVVAFSTARTFTGIVRQLVVQSCQPIGSEMARQQAMGERDKLRRTYAAGSRLTCGIAGLLGGIALVAGAPFMELWTHGAVPNDPLLLGAFLLSIFLTAPAQISQALFQYNNRPGTLVVAQSAYTGMAILLCIALIPHYQAAGAAFGVGAAEFLSLGLVVPFAAARVAGIGLAPYLGRSYLVVAALFAGSSAIAGALAKLIEPRTYGALAAMAMAWAALAAWPSFRMLLSSREREWCVSLARRMFSRGLFLLRR